MKKNIILFSLTTFIFADVKVLDNITVSATKFDENLSKIPMSVSVLTDEQLFKYSTTSLYDTFSKELGVNVTGGEGRSQNINIRGISGNRIKIIKDGISVSDGYGADNLNDKAGFYTFDMANIKEVEIIKSANLQGQSSLGGTILVKSKQLEDYLQDKNSYFQAISKYTGISDKLQQNLAFAYRLDELSFGAKGNFANSKQTKNYEKNVYKRDIDSYAYSFLQAYEFPWAYQKFTFEYFNEKAIRKESDITPTQDDGIWNPDKFDEKITTESYTISNDLEFQTDFSLFQENYLKLYYRNTQNNLYQHILESRELANMVEKKTLINDNLFEDEIKGISLNSYNQILNHEVSYGINADFLNHRRPMSRISIKDTVLKKSDKNPFHKSKTFLLSSYLTDKFDIKTLTIRPSIRYDFHKLSTKKHKDKTSWAISPGIAVTQNFSDKFNMYFSWAYGYKAPTYDKVFANVPHIFGNPLSDFILAPNLDLKKETSQNYEIGAKFKDDFNSFSLAFYYSNYKDFISPRITERKRNYSIQQYINIGKAKIYGYEASYERTIGLFRILSSIAYINGKDENKEYLQTLNPLRGGFEINFDYDKLNIYSRLNWESSMKRTPKCYAADSGDEVACAKTKSYGSVDIGTSYTYKNYSVSLNINNLFNKRYVKYQDVAGRAYDMAQYDAANGRYANISFKMEF